MQTMPPVTQNELTRQERLKLWIWKSLYSQAEIARRIGVTSTCLCRWLRVDRLPVRCVEQMRAFGIPEDLLPRAEDVPTGKKRRIPLKPPTSLEPPPAAQ